MNDSQASRFVRSASHWGTFWAEVRDGRVVGVKPFEHDTDPSPMIDSMAEAVYAENRIDRPYVREGFLKTARIRIAAAGAPSRSCPSIGKRPSIWSPRK